MLPPQHQQEIHNPVLVLHDVCLPEDVNIARYVLFIIITLHKHRLARALWASKSKLHTTLD